MRGLKTTVFGVITVSVDVRIVNLFVFLAILVRLYPNFNAYTFRDCVTFSGKKITTPPSPNVPVRLWEKNVKCRPKAQKC